MTDNDLIIAMRAALLSRLAAPAYGLADLQVKQSNQPTQQGVPTARCIFVSKINDKRVGSPQRASRWNELESRFDYVESEQIETTFQVTATTPQDPADDAELTAADLVKAAARAMQSDPVLILLRAAGVGVLRVGDIRTGYSDDDRGQFQQNPSFDVTLTHRNTTVETLAPVTAAEVQTHRV